MALLSSVSLLLAIGIHTPAKVPARPVLEKKAASACVAVTKNDVESALGRLVKLGEADSSAERSTCDYASDGGQVSVTLVHVKEKLDVAAEVEALRADFPQASIREVKGIGMRAFFLDVPEAGTQLHVLRGEHDYLMVSVLGFGAPEQVAAAAEKMARQALDRL